VTALSTAQIDAFEAQRPGWLPSVTP
jgi:hypothetical protein